MRYILFSNSYDKAPVRDPTDRQYLHNNVITDAIKFVQINKEKLTMSTKGEDNGKESKEPDYDEDKDQLEEKQEEETGELKEDTTNQVL